MPDCVRGVTMKCYECEYANYTPEGIYCNLRTLLVSYDYEKCMAYYDWHNEYFDEEEE